MMKIYYAKIGEEPEEELPENIRRHIAEYRNETVRRRSLCAWRLFMMMAAEEGVETPEIGFYEYGKPYFIQPAGWYFSLSHSEEYAACALARKPVGVDIQKIRPVDLGVPRRSFSEEEQQKLRLSNSPEEELIRIWTLKEAVVKASGLGLRQDLRYVNASAGSYKSWKLEDYIVSVYCVDACELPDQIKRIFYK